MARKLASESWAARDYDEARSQLVPLGASVLEGCVTRLPNALPVPSRFAGCEGSTLLRDALGGGDGRPEDVAHASESGRLIHPI